jgi:hypothetical protein
MGGGEAQDAAKGGVSARFSSGGFWACDMTLPLLDGVLALLHAHAEILHERKAPARSAFQAKSRRHSYSVTTAPENDALVLEKSPRINRQLDIPGRVL